MRLGPRPGLGTAQPRPVHLADQRPLAVRPDPTHAGEIEVRFLADGPTQTTVEVEHRYFERLVGGESVHSAIRSGGGWPALLDSYARMVKDQTGTDQTGTDPA